MRLKLWLKVTCFEIYTFLNFSKLFKFAYFYSHSIFTSVGTLDGFSFDSEDEAEKITKVASCPTVQNEPVEGLNTKSKNKAEKSSVCF